MTWKSDSSGWGFNIGAVETLEAYAGFTAPVPPAIEAP